MSRWWGGVAGWAAPSGPLGTYRIYATGQTLTSGSNGPVDMNAATETSTGTIDIAYEEDPFSPGVYQVTVHDAGVYSAAASMDWGGTTSFTKSGQIDAFDSGPASASTGQFLMASDPSYMDTADLGSSPYGFDAEGKITFTTPNGFFFLAAGPGLVSGVTITSATYFEITRWS